MNLTKDTIMGIYASYYAIDESQVNKYKTLLANNDDDSTEDFFESLEEIEDDTNYTDLEKLWDGLHFLLTGFASYDDENDNKTSEQIALYDGFFGSEPLNDEGVSLLNADKVADVVNALNHIDIDKLLEDVDFDDFTKADLYPDIWYNEDKEDLSDELKAYFINFKQFYENALKNGRSVLIVIC